MGTAAFALLSKYLFKVGGSHIFNPSNIGLVVCFLLLGPERAEPLDFWWGPMSGWLAFALIVIVGGGLADPHAAAPARDRGRLLALVRGRHRPARAHRPRDDRALAPRPDHRALLLVGARHLAGDPRLHVLHDHRPEDDPEVEAWAGDLRGLGRPSRRPPDRTCEDRVLEQGRRAGRARDRLRGAAPARARAGDPVRAATARSAGRRRARRLHRRDRGGGDPGAPRSRPSRRSRTPAGCRSSRSSPRRASRRCSTGRPRTGSRATSSRTSSSRRRPSRTAGRRRSAARRSATS